MPKTPDERIEFLEKRINTYRILAILLFVLLFVTQRQKIVGWIDSAERWFGGVSQVRAS